MFCCFKFLKLSLLNCHFAWLRHGRRPSRVPAGIQAADSQSSHSFRKGSLTAVQPGVSQSRFHCIVLFLLFCFCIGFVLSLMIHWLSLNFRLDQDHLIELSEDQAHFDNGRKMFGQSRCAHKRDQDNVPQSKWNW